MPATLNRLKRTLKSARISREQTTIDFKDETFNDHVSYYEVFLNFDFNTPVDCWIEDTELAYKKLNLEKRIIMGTGFTIQEGDYVHWSSDIDSPVTQQNQGDLLLALGQDNQYPFESAGLLTRCSTDPLKWKDENGLIHSWGCIINNVSKYTTGFDEGKYIWAVDDQVEVLVQMNDEPRTIGLNDRFIFGTSVFSITRYDDYTGNRGNKLLKLIMNKVAVIVGKDDFVNQIAWNEIIETLLDLEILNANIEAIIGAQIQIETEIKYNGFSQQRSLTYQSADTNIATVNDTGLITCVANGSTIIAVSLTENPAVSKTVSLNVVSVPTDNIIINLESVNGESKINNTDLSIEAYIEFDDNIRIQKWNNGVLESDTFTITILEGNQFFSVNQQGNEFELVTSNIGNGRIQIEDTQSNTVVYSVKVIGFY